MSKGRAQDNFRAKAPWIMTLLMRDLPIGLDDAVAFLGNLGHESGGLTALQEINPTVKGSKGGYGWGQWTGPRRRAFMAWCIEHGLKPAADEANYRFLVHELRGPEKAAIPAVKRAKTLAAKVKAFELGFERAGIKHYPSRNQWAAIARDAWEANPTPSLPRWALPAGKPQDTREAPAAPKGQPTPPRPQAPLPAPREPELMPIEVPGLDKSLPKSTTVWATIIGFFTTVLGALQALDWRIALALITVAAIAAIWIIRERRRYRNAQRDIVAGITGAGDF